MSMVAEDSRGYGWQPREWHDSSSQADYVGDGVVNS
jgi:hypothetical protein